MAYEPLPTPAVDSSSPRRPASENRSLDLVTPYVRQTTGGRESPLIDSGCVHQPAARTSRGGRRQATEEVTRVTPFEPVLRAADGLYLALQGALKAYGLLHAEGAPPEVITRRGRFAVLSERPGRWPELRVALPESAAHWFTVESFYRRAGVWRASTSPEEVADFYRRWLRKTYPFVVEEEKRGQRLFTVGGRESDLLVRVTPHPRADTVLTLGQRIERFRTGPEGEALLPRPPESTLPAPAAEA